MPFLFICIFLFLTVSDLWSQSNTLTNSFEKIYEKANSSINYKYDQEKHIHDYSNNWDFDKDGNADKVYFVGTGGAHLYYFLRVILSSDNISRNFHFIQSDLPLLPTEEQLNKIDFKPNNNETYFAVLDHGNDRNPDIFVKLDSASFDANKKTLKKKGIKSNFILITFKNGKTIFKDFINSNQVQKTK